MSRPARGGYGRGLGGPFPAPPDRADADDADDTVTRRDATTPRLHDFTTHEAPSGDESQFTGGGCR